MDGAASTSELAEDERPARRMRVRGFRGGGSPEAVEEEEDEPEDDDAEAAFPC